MKSKKTLSTKVIVPVVALGIIVMATLSSVSLASAQQSEAGRETLISRIATKFGLNEAEVEETFDAFRSERGEERHMRMQGMLEERLEKKVEDGDLTEDQMLAMLTRHEELENDHDDLYNLSSEERREAKADMHEEMEAWAQENDINMEAFGRFKDGYGQGDGSMQGKRFIHRE